MTTFFKKVEFMEKIILKKALLFKELNEYEIKDALKILNAKTFFYDKDDNILSAGDTTDSLGLIISGQATIESNDLWGNRTILSSVKAGQFFAETYAFLSDEPLSVDVVANKPCEVLFINVNRLSLPEVHKTSWAYKMTYNLLTISTKKNIILSKRSFHIAQKTIRNRLMAYLNSFSLQVSSSEFDIPFDRQQLADYLNVERTALSKELGKMKSDGIIEFRKNHFKILFTDFE